MPDVEAAVSTLYRWRQRFESFKPLTCVFLWEIDAALSIVRLPADLEHHLNVEAVLAGSETAHLCFLLELHHPASDPPMARITAA